MSRNAQESEFTSPPLLVSTLAVHNTQSRAEVEAIVLTAGIIKKEIHRVISPGGTHEERFRPPLEIPLHTKILVHIHTGGRFRTVVPISLDPNVISEEVNRDDGKPMYYKTEQNIQVALGVQTLPPTVSEIVESCDRFRVLIIGKSGVGKSSLINKVFGVSRVDVSNVARGIATINQEHTALENNRFVVHDSCGFEAADRRNLDDARRFIIERRSMQDIKNQLHAVWLCLEIPFAGSRVLETGVEEFLKDRDRILGNTPLVVVFTKLDSLVNMLKAQALRVGQILDNDALKERTDKALEKYCLEPIQKAIGNNSLSLVAVSTKDGYDHTLSELFKMTTTCIQKHVKDWAARYIATIAQRVNIALKVEAIVALGERKYWKMLKDSPNFQGHPMKACLDVLHKDIVTVWNFKDPHRSLDREDFKEALLERSKYTPQSGMLVTTALIAIIGLAKTSGATFFVTLPAISGAALCKLANRQYKASQDTVRQLMAYIIDLTCVMQILLLLIAARDNEASPETVGAAMQAYRTTYRPNVHGDINEFQVNIGITRKQDEVLEKVKELICKYRIPDEDIVRFRRELQS